MQACLEDNYLEIETGYASVDDIRACDARSTFSDSLDYSSIKKFE